VHVATHGRAVHRSIRGQAAVDPPHPRLVAVAVAGHRVPARSRAGAGRGGDGRQVPAPVDRERRAHRSRDVAVLTVARHHHLARRLHADHRAGARRPVPVGRGGHRAAEHRVRVRQGPGSAAAEGSGPRRGPTGGDARCERRRPRRRRGR
ncbi:MAG: hypothetical protein AMXMBFR46_02480, partial [Acidimicrobiia bacterium]